MSNYRIVIRGVQAGQSADQVAQELARFSKKTPEALRLLLQNRRPVLAKRAPDSQSALRYKQMLEKLGCACLIEAEITEPASAAADNAAATSLTGFTASYANTPAPAAAREYQYRKAPIGVRLQEIARVLRLKALTATAMLAGSLYYGWAHGLFR